MARVIGYVKSLEYGSFFVKDAKGNVRELKAGEAIHEGETVYGAKGNPSNAQIVIDVTLQGMGDLVIAGNGALNFDTSLLKGIFAHEDAVVYVNSVKDALALAGGDITNVETDLRDGQTAGEDETAAGQTLTDQERASDTFNNRDGLIGDVRTALNFTDSTRTTPTNDDQPFRPVVLEIPVELGTPTITHVGDVDPAINNVTVTEGTAAVFTVNLSNASSTPTSFALALSDGSANLTSDYTAALTFSNGVTYDSATGQVSVPANVTSFTVTVPTVNDTTSEPSENFTLSVGGVEGTGNITDNDPTAQNDSGAVNEDATLTVTAANGVILSGSAASGRDTDPDGDTLTVSAVRTGAESGSGTAGTVGSSLAGTYGHLTLNTNGSYTYVADQAAADALATGVVAHDIFTYTISDGEGGSDVAQLDITVTGINDAPIIGAINSTTYVSEEGLVNGIADTTGNPTDTTNLVTSSGTMNISDIDSTVTVTLVAPTTTLTSGGTNVTWTLSSDQKTLTGMAGSKEVITVNINNSGAYTVTLKAPIDHATTSVEDVKSLAIGVKATDGIATTNGTLTVNIEDDAPTAGNITQSITLPIQDSNVTLVLDVSGSMGTKDGPGGITRLATLQQAANNLLDGYDNFGDVKVRIVTFSTNAAASGSLWMTVAEAKTAINALTANGGTNYDEALADTISAFTDSGKINGGSNVAYFISDGAPTFGSGTTSELAPAGQSPGTPSTNGTGNDQSGSDTGIQSAEQTIWENFLTNNDVKSYAIGIGSGAVSTYLEPIAFDGNTGTQPAPIMVTDLSQLSSVLQKTIVPPTAGSLSGNLGSSSYGLGADGGYIKSLTVNGITYTYNPVAHTITPSGTGGSTYTYNATTDVLTITTADKGILTVDLKAATYTYQAPATLATSATLTETIGFAMNDNDGDSASGTLTLNVAHATEVMLTSTSTAIATSGMGLSGEYFGYNDNRTGTATDPLYSGQTRLHSDDGTGDTGTANNIDTLADVEEVIEGRNNDTTLINSSRTGAANAADATFTAYKLEYGVQAGTNTTLFSSDLGQNRAVTSGTVTTNNGTGTGNNNLYTFLKGSNTANSSNITVTSGVGDTTDAIIRMVGYVYVVGGTYDLRVTGDDGYRILIGGQVVAQMDQIQSTTTNVFTNKTIADGWQPIEILYWDQAGEAAFRLETKLTGTPDSAYKIVSTDTMPILNANQTPPVLTEQQDMVDTGTGTWSIRTGATYNGDAADNYVTGTDGKDVIHGGDGNDVIDGGANKDWLYGDAGNDKLLFDAKDVVVDGGAGIDTLILSTGTSINFNTLDSSNNPIKNMEVIDLGTTGQHSLTNISLQDVIDMTDTNNDLYILGNSADTVDFLSGNGWSKQTSTVTEVINGQSHEFNVYSNAQDATVKVEVTLAIDTTL